jgi:hypothetical protein
VLRPFDPDFLGAHMNFGFDAEQERWQHFALSGSGLVIGGGTPNVQKNIIAERILDLPHD